MDNHITLVYNNAVKYLNVKKININHNILEYACKYHHCVPHKFKTRLLLYNELKPVFDIITIDIIIQLIDALKQGPPASMAPIYVEYINALRYGEKLAPL